MRNVLKDRRCTEYILQVIMEKKDLKVIDQTLQKDYKNLQGRSAVLDCVVRDAEGKQINVEIQQDTEGITYVNSGCQEETELGRLMHDFHCKSAVDMYNEVLARRVYELKETQEGVDHMCREMDKIYSEGEERGEMKAKRETAYELYDEDGFSPEKIAKRVKVSVSTVEKWLNERALAANTI